MPEVEKEYGKNPVVKGLAAVAAPLTALGGFALDGLYRIGKFFYIPGSGIFASGARSCLDISAKGAKTIGWNGGEKFFSDYSETIEQADRDSVKEGFFNQAVEGKDADGKEMGWAERAVKGIFGFITYAPRFAAGVVGGITSAVCNFVGGVANTIGTVGFELAKSVSKWADRQEGLLWSVGKLGAGTLATVGAAFKTIGTPFRIIGDGFAKFTDCFKDSACNFIHDWTHGVSEGANTAEFMGLKFMGLDTTKKRLEIGKLEDVTVPSKITDDTGKAEYTTCMTKALGLLRTIKSPRFDHKSDITGDDMRYTNLCEFEFNGATYKTLGGFDGNKIIFIKSGTFSNFGYSGTGVSKDGSPPIGIKEGEYKGFYEAATTALASKIEEAKKQKTGLSLSEFKSVVDSYNNKKDQKEIKKLVGADDEKEVSKHGCNIQFNDTCIVFRRDNSTENISLNSKTFFNFLANCCDPERAKTPSSSVEGVKVVEKVNEEVNRKYVSVE